ncbi:NirD/YgiW/YdeI family stress tolerance protein [Leptolyngbya ohadii]|uniref:NirD/YgiW/YdeI family stress tolerance protein n=1 Tax=Leptolyngbya ohadii TaxID=1962290 RepID=UPI000B5A21BE|nr:NirD/YgiW/YdeI family stress tolerance protein [Leptolyngbya ohadii]
MKLGFTAAVSLIALLAGSVAVTASPLERRSAQSLTAQNSIAQNPNPQNPNPQNPSSLSIANLQRMNSVTIAGEVVQVRGEEFILRDGTGEMLVEAESPAIRQANLKAGDRVTIAGQYDDDSFEAFSITPANGTVIYVFDD